MVRILMFSFVGALVFLFLLCAFGLNEQYKQEAKIGFLVLLVFFLLFFLFAD